MLGSGELYFIFLHSVFFCSLFPLFFPTSFFGSWTFPVVQFDAIRDANIFSGDQLNGWTKISSLRNDISEPKLPPAGSERKRVWRRRREWKCVFVCVRKRENPLPRSYFLCMNYDRIGPFRSGFFFCGYGYFIKLFVFFVQLLFFVLVSPPRNKNLTAGWYGQRSAFVQLRHGWEGCEVRSFAFLAQRNSRCRCIAAVVVIGIFWSTFTGRQCLAARKAEPELVRRGYKVTVFARTAKNVGHTKWYKRCRRGFGNRWPLTCCIMCRLEISKKKEKKTKMNVWRLFKPRWIDKTDYRLDYGYDIGCGFVWSLTN